MKRSYEKMSNYQYLNDSTDNNNDETINRSRLLKINRITKSKCESTSQENVLLNINMDISELNIYNHDRNNDKYCFFDLSHIVDKCLYRKYDGSIKTNDYYYLCENSQIMNNVDSKREYIQYDQEKKYISPLPNSKPLQPENKNIGQSPTFDKNITLSLLHVNDMKNLHSVHSCEKNQKANYPKYKFDFRFIINMVSYFETEFFYNNIFKDLDVMSLLSFYHVFSNFKSKKIINQNNMIRRSILYLDHNVNIWLNKKLASIIYYALVKKTNCNIAEILYHYDNIILSDNIINQQYINQFSKNNVDLSRSFPLSKMVGKSQYLPTNESHEASPLIKSKSCNSDNIRKKESHYRQHDILERLIKYGICIKCRCRPVITNNVLQCDKYKEYVDTIFPKSKSNISIPYTFTKTKNGNTQIISVYCDQCTITSFNNLSFDNFNINAFSTILMHNMFILMLKLDTTYTCKSNIRKNIFRLPPSSSLVNIGQIVDNTYNNCIYPILCKKNNNNRSLFNYSDIIHSHVSIDDINQFDILKYLYSKMSLLSCIIIYKLCLLLDIHLFNESKLIHSIHDYPNVLIIGNQKINIYTILKIAKYNSKYTHIINHYLLDTHNTYELITTLQINSIIPNYDYINTISISKDYFDKNSGQIPLFTTTKNKVKIKNTMLKYQIQQHSSNYKKQCTKISLWSIIFDIIPQIQNNTKILCILLNNMYIN